MNEFQATAVMVALFALRCVVPFVAMLAIGYAMNRLVSHWEAEEAAERAAKPVVALPVVAPARAPKPNVPCWVYKNCDEKKRAACPAYAAPTLACWVARLRADGKMPPECAGCALYTMQPALASGD